MKTKKIIFATAGAFILIGILISGLAISMGALIHQNVLFSTQNIEVVENIIIRTSTDDIKISYADTDSITISYYGDRLHDYTIGGEGTPSLIMEPISKNIRTKWYDYIDFDFRDTDNINITVPQSIRANMELYSDYGDIKVSGSGENLAIVTQAGDIHIKNSSFISLKCESRDGDIELSNTEASISVDSISGDIELKNISGNNINLNTKSGDIEGNINAAESDYSVTAQSIYGDCSLNNHQNGNKIFNASTESGDIYVKFLPRQATDNI